MRRGGRLVPIARRKRDSTDIESRFRRAIGTWEREGLGEAKWASRLFGTLTHIALCRHRGTQTVEGRETRVAPRFAIVDHFHPHPE